MRTLWRKEFQSLYPFLFLLLVLCGSDALSFLLTAYPDQQPLGKTFFPETKENSTFNNLILLLLTFSLCLGLLNREFDEETIPFLDTLPVSRIQIFWVKLTTATLLFYVFWSLVPLGVRVFLHRLSPHSIDPSYHAGILTTFSLLELAQIVVLLSWGILLSFLKRFSWVVWGLLIALYTTVSSRFPGISILNPFDLIHPTYYDQQWVVPWTMLLVQLSLAGISLTLACFLFTNHGDRIDRFYRKSTQHLGGRIAMGFATFLIVVLSLLMGAYFLSKDWHNDTASDTPGIEYPNWTTSQIHTRHFTLIYPSNLERRAQNLAEKADEVYDQVRDFFRIDPSLDEIITVDLTGAGRHYAGVTFWNMIKMGLLNPDLQELQATLGHETTHALIDRISQRRLEDHFHFTRFFHEGLATHVEHQKFRPPEALSKIRFIAAITADRDKIPFPLLVDDSAFVKTYATETVYSFGEIFISALVDTYGEESITKLLKSFGQPNLPTPSGGMEWWYSRMQVCGFDLEKVVNRFQTLIAQEIETHRPSISQLPRLHGKVVRTKGYLRVTCDTQPPPDWQVVCRFRTRGDATLDDFLEPDEEEDRSFFISKSHFAEATFGLQLGLHKPTDQRVVYEPWVEVPLYPAR